MSYLTYMDESGDVSFAETSSSQFFIITCLTIPENAKHKLKNKIKQKKKKLYNLGWPREVEIKAATLRSINHNRKLRAELGVDIDGDKYIQEIIRSIIDATSPRIDYFALNKTRIIHDAFKNAEYGIAYNFFSAKLLCPLVMDLKKCKLYPDPRNKERHSNKDFTEYIDGEIFYTAKQMKIEVDFSMHLLPSHTNPGLMSVDFFSWSLNRYFAHQDDSFYNLFKRLVHNNGIRWYC